MKHLSTALLALSLAMFGVQPVMASVISDGSAGVFRPTTDFTLDLTGTTLPQFTSIFVDAGVRLTVLTPTNGVFGDLLAANDIFVNGVIDAGSGNLGLYAGNQIVLGTGSQLIAGSLFLSAFTIDILGTVTVVGGSGLPGTIPGGLSGPVNRAPFNPNPRGPLTSVPEPSTIMLLLPGLALLARKSRLRE